MQNDNPELRDAGKGRKCQSFGVAPSPFNGVKLELGVVITISVLLLLALDSITDDGLIQIAVLFAAGVTGMVWILWRTRKVLKAQRSRE